MRGILTSLDRSLARTGMNSAGALVLLVLLAALLYLPAVARLPVTDRDEARFVQASRQMVETGDYIDIRFQDAPRYKKPVGIYWLQAAAVSALPSGAESAVWGYRLPSLAGALGAVLMTFALARALAGGPAGGATALTAAMLLSAALVLAGEARIAKTDAALLATILAAQTALAVFYRDRVHAPRWAFLFWGALGVSVLIKGPIGPMVVGLTALSLAIVEKEARWLSPVFTRRALLLFAVIVLPWYIAITWRTGAAFWHEALIDDLVSKTQSGQEGHGAPPGTYLALVWVTFWPGSALLAPLLPEIWRQRRGLAIRFALCWLLPGWLVFEAIPTKLIHYTLPFFPALALLIAFAWAARDRALPRGARALSVVLALIGPGLLVAAAGYAYRVEAGALWPALIALPVALGFVALYAGTLAADLRFASVAVLALLGITTYAGIFGTLARVDFLWPSRGIVTAIGRADCPAPEVAAAGFAEPSLVFELGRRVLFTDAAGAASFLADGGCRVAVIGSGLDYSGPGVPLGEVQGFSLGAGREVSVNILAAPRR